MAVIPTSASPDGTEPLEEVNVLHFSDIHFGYGFRQRAWKVRWKDALRIAGETLPQLVIVSGDFVNSPWRWALRGARKKLDALRAESHCRHMVCVPGNHDTRILGIVPVTTVYPTLTFILVVSAVAHLLHWWPRAADAAFVMALSLLILRFLCMGKFEQYFDSTPHYTRLNDLRLELFCFDSASSGAYWAQGKIRSGQFVNARTELEQGGGKDQPFMRIGILHHHALPIPYEHNSEPMMVLRNAGAFLKEASKLGISLVLHGHRHRFSFGRITVEANTSTPSEIAVLSTGSPTANTEIQHNLNLITIDHRWGAAKITPFWSRNRQATFADEPPFFARSIGDSARELFSLNARRQGCFCKRMIVTVDINTDGDAQRAIEYWGFQTVAGETRRDVPGRIDAGLEIGHLERPRLRHLGGAPGLNVNFEDAEAKLRSYSARIVFNRDLNAGEATDFSWRYHAINSYAMSQQQYLQMYEPRRGEPTEWCRATVKNVPAAELVMIVKLPTGFAIPARAARLFVGRLDGELEPDLQREFEGGLRYLITVRVPYPPLGMHYRLEWPLPPKPPPSSMPAEHLRGRVLDLVKKMHGISNPSGAESPLNRISEAVLDLAAEEFGLNSEDRKSLEFSLMAYEGESRLLRVVAGSFAKDDARWRLKIPYGDGIAGRAYKNNFPRVFIKQLAIRNGTPFYYLPLEDVPLSPDGREVTEEVVVSMPLYCPGNREDVFAVLSVSSKNAGSNLVDLTEETIKIKGEFPEAVADLCQRVLDALSGVGV